MRKALALVLLFAGAPPMCVGTLSIFLGAALLPEERDAGRVAIGVGIAGVLIGLGLCLTVYAALRHGKK
jgi:hypothetical protein